MIEFDHVSRFYAPPRHAGDSLRCALAFRRPAHREVFNALDDVSFHLRAGESLGIAGRNGAGKSTLLKILTRVARPSVGQVTVRGRMASLLEVGAGFHHDLSGRENIFLAGAIQGLSARAVRRRLDDIVSFSGLAPFLDAPVRTYSSGMFLRLAFSVGMHLDHDILVIDEALAVGDRAFQAQCLDKIRAFQRRGGTLILVSHDEQQLASVCRRGLWLDNGRVRYDGDIGTAMAQYAAAD